MLAKYPFNDELLINAQVLDVSKRTEGKFSSVEYLVRRFNLDKGDDATFMDELEEQFNLYTIDKDITFNPGKRIDVQWHEIGLITDSSNSAKYGHLVFVAKAKLVCFHSNADCERIFSILEKTKTSRGHLCLQRV